MEDIKMKLKAIADLMADLQEQMEYGEEDFSERLGREKPKVEVLEIEGKLPMEGEEDLEEDMDMDMGEDEDEMLKKRLMKMRGQNGFTTVQHRRINYKY